MLVKNLCMKIKHLLVIKNINEEKIKELDIYKMVTDNRFAHTLAYKWVTSGNESFKSNDYQSTGSGGGGSLRPGFGTGSPYNQNTGVWKGPNTRWKGTYNFGILGNSADNSSSRFE